MSRFDGHTWTSYDSTNSGIPGEGVFKVAVGPDGRVWLHSRGINGSLGMGLTVFNGTDWFTYTSADSSLADDDIRSLAVDLNGHLWIGTWDGDVNRFDGASWTTFPNINYNGLAIHSLAVDSLNRKWFISLPSTVWMYDGQTWQSFAPQNGCQDYLRDAAAGVSGTVWFATLAGVCSFDGSVWNRYDNTNSQIATNAVWTVATQGSKWWAGYELQGPGVTEFNAGTWRQYVPAAVLPGNIGSHGLAVVELPRAETWFGATPGVAVLDNDGWTAYGPTNSELKGSCVNGITKGLNGHLWFAGGNCGGGLVEYDPVGKVWTQHAGLGGVPDPFVFSVAAGSDGRIWAGSRGGLSVYNGSGWLTYDTSNSDLPNNRVESIAIDSAGHIWTGCTSRFDGFVWTLPYADIGAAVQAHYNEIKDTVFEDRRCWLVDSAARVWINAPLAAVKYYNGSAWTSFSLAAMGHTLPYGWVASLAGKDQSGAIWVTIKDFNNTHGFLSRFTGAAWTAFTPNDGFIDPPGDLTVDHLGRTWVSGFRGFSLYYNPFQPTSLTTGPSAGVTVSSIDDAISANFPAGAFSSTVRVTLTPLPALANGGPVSLGRTFRLEAAVEGTGTPVNTAALPYTLSVQYGGGEVWSIQEETLALYWWDGQQWVRETVSMVDSTLNRVSAVISHLGLFSVWGEAAPPPPVVISYPVYLPLILHP